MPTISKCIEALSNNFLGSLIRPFDLYEEGFKKLSLLGFQGIGLYALAALDIAFWDAFAKAANAPLAIVLGGELKPIPTYNSRGLWLIQLNKIEDEVKELLSDGEFKALKVRIGRTMLEEDIEVIKKLKQLEEEI